MGQDPNVSKLVAALKNDDKVNDITEDEFDQLFNDIKGDDEALITGEKMIWNQEGFINVDTFGDDRENDFDMLDEMDDGTHQTTLQES